MNPPGVEECLDQIPNRFELCAVAVKRARQLVRGADSMLPLLGHKATVQSLAEIASGQVSRAILEDADLALPDPPSRAFDVSESFDGLLEIPHSYGKHP